MTSDYLTEEPTTFGAQVTAWNIFRTADSVRTIYLLAQNFHDPEKSWINPRGEWWAWDELVDVKLANNFIPHKEEAFDSAELALSDHCARQENCTCPTDAQLTVIVDAVLTRMNTYHKGKIEAGILREVASEFFERSPDGTGNGRAYNSHTVAHMLRARADKISD